MNDSDKQKINEALQQKVGTIVCPICHNKQFTLLDGCFANVIQDSLPGIKVDGTYIPSVAIVCNHCGFISHHSIGILGLMDLIKVTKE